MSHASKNYNAQLTAAAASTALHGTKKIYNSNENDRAVNSFLGNRTSYGEAVNGSPQYDYMRSRMSTLGSANQPMAPPSLRNRSSVYLPTPAGPPQIPVNTGKRYTLTSSSANYMTKSERQMRPPKSYDFPPSQQVRPSTSRSPSYASYNSEEVNFQSYQDPRLLPRTSQMYMPDNNYSPAVKNPAAQRRSSSYTVPANSRGPPANYNTPYYPTAIPPPIEEYSPSVSLPTSPVAEESYNNVQRSSTVRNNTTQKSVLKKPSRKMSPAYTSSYRQNSPSSQVPPVSKKHVIIYENKEGSSSSESVYEDVFEDFDPSGSNQASLRSTSTIHYTPSSKRISVIPPNTSNIGSRVVSRSGQNNTQPVQPGQYNQQSQPVQSYQSGQSTQHFQPVQPIQPVQSTQYYQPSSPVQPVQNGVPAPPMQPVQSTQYYQPSSPVQPVQNVKPAQPAQPSLEDAAKRRVEEMLRQMDITPTASSTTANNAYASAEPHPSAFPDDMNSVFSDSSFERERDSGRGRSTNLFSKFKSGRSRSKASGEAPYSYPAPPVPSVNNAGARLTLRDSGAAPEPTYSLRQPSNHAYSEGRSYTFTGGQPPSVSTMPYGSRFANDSDSMMGSTADFSSKKKGGKFKAFKKFFKMRF